MGQMEAYSDLSPEETVDVEFFRQLMCSYCFANRQKSSIKAPLTFRNTQFSFHFQYFASFHRGRTQKSF